MKDHRMEMAGATVAIQGMGNVGGNAARFLADEGCKIVAISDSRGGLYNTDGLNPSRVALYKDEHGTLEGFVGADYITNKELLELPCDVLIPAALENVITEKNAPEIKARMLVEAANIPTSPEADRVLEDKGVVVMPDILANAGGVCVSYFEWTQNLQASYWEEDRVNRKLMNTLIGSYSLVKLVSEQNKVSLRTASYALAIGRVAKAVKLRGY